MVGAGIGAAGRRLSEGGFWGYGDVQFAVEWGSLTQSKRRGRRLCLNCDSCGSEIAMIDAWTEGGLFRILPKQLLFGYCQRSFRVEGVTSKKVMVLLLNTQPDVGFKS